MLKRFEVSIGDSLINQRVILLAVSAKRAAPGVTAQCNQLPYRQAIGAGRVLGQVADNPGKGAGAEAFRGFTLKPDLTGTGRNLSGQCFQQCGFARAVVAKQGGYLAFVKGQANVMKDSRAANVDSEVADFEKRGHSDSPVSVAGRII